MRPFPDLLAVGAVVFAVATWIIPLMRLALWKAYRSSLATVGQVLGFLVLAASVSATGLLFALLTILLSQRAGWGWFSLAAIAAFWVSLWTVLYIVNRDTRRQRIAGNEGPLHSGNVTSDVEESDAQNPNG